YSALTAWLILTFFIRKSRVSPDIITYGFVIFLISILFSSFFSIDPTYSFSSLKRDALKAVIAFLIISTYFDIKMLFGLSKVICFSGLIILCFGLHDFLLGKTPFFTSTNIFLSVDYNEYGFFIGYLLPFFLIFIIKGEGWKKRLLELSLISGIFGIILTSSRGAIGNLFGTLGIWTIFFLKRAHLKKVFIATVITILFIIVSFNSCPEFIKTRILSTSKDLKTFGLRTNFHWEPAIDAVKKRPLFGWGYGNKIYRDQRPFENVKKPNWEPKGGLHSSFITVLFHQGIFGILSYSFLLLSTTFVLFKMTINERNDIKLLALALLSIMVGSFIINSLVLSVPLRRLAPILGMSAALYKFIK
ncbi:MAG: O-antigen ligase family protein, partial [Thermodesulfovibrionales bacterium]